MLFILRSLKYLFVSSLLLSVVVILFELVRSLHQKRSVFDNNTFGKQEKFQFARDVDGNSYVERLETINKVCGELTRKGPLSLKNLDVLDHILVDSKHQLLYCYVPKVACTNWKRIFMILTGRTNASDVLSIPAHEAHSRSVYLTLRNYTTIDAEYLLNTYTKFLFVRHPFERLLSAYRNKLEQNYLSSKYFQERIGKYIIQNYRSSLKNVSQIKGNDVTFEEFTTFLVNSAKNGFNEHWKPIHSLCEPCYIKYDFVGKYETLWNDANFILKSIGVSNFTFPYAPRSSSTSKQLRRYFSNLSSERISNLYEIYKLDFKMFSYSSADLLGYEVG
uniref:Carbohydrate sulfotransferase n=2 Tax=Lygus hesperus TaxID=30085 RepID=A0A0A9Z3E0_LYGHE